MTGFSKVVTNEFELEALDVGQVPRWARDGDERVISISTEIVSGRRILEVVTYRSSCVASQLRGTRQVRAEPWSAPASSRNEPPSCSARRAMLLRPCPSVGPCGPTPSSTTLTTSSSADVSIRTSTCVAFAWRATLASASRRTASRCGRTKSGTPKSIAPAIRTRGSNPNG